MILFDNDKRKTGQLFDKDEYDKFKTIKFVGLLLKNDKNNILINQSFNEEFSYDVQSDKFGMAQYEENITDNLNGKISSDIIFLLGTLK